jgi:hypothetical protein
MQETIIAVPLDLTSEPKPNAAGSEPSIEGPSREVEANGISRVNGSNENLEKVKAPQARRTFEDFKAPTRYSNESHSGSTIAGTFSSNL